MGQDLIDIQDLMLLLGYTDPRSVKKWCAQKKILIISLGLKKYVSQHILTQYIDNQFVTFVNTEKTNEIEYETEKKVAKQKLAEKANTMYHPESKIAAKYLSKYESRH